MSESPGDLLRDTVDRLATEYEVDAGLARLLASDSREAAQTLDRALLQRVRALEGAAAEVAILRRRVAQLAEIQPFTEAGWKQRKSELLEKLDGDATAGLASWFADWARAAAHCQLPALERLIFEIELPPAASILRERCLAATVGVARLDSDLAGPTLRAAASGVELGSETVPDQDTREMIGLLLARLAIGQGRLEEAGAALDVVHERDQKPAARALRARLAWMREESRLAADQLEAARAQDPTSLAVTVESIAQRGDELPEETALEMARMAIDALPHIVHAERELRPMPRAVPGVVWLALAERAFREGEFECGDWATRTAFDTDADDATLAQIAQLRADSLELRDDTAESRADALLLAGSRWLSAAELESAQAAIEKALELGSKDTEAPLLLASALVGLAEPLRVEAARGKLERALELIADVRSREDFDSFVPWAYVIEAAAQQLLARAALPPAAPKHRSWRALEASARALAHTGAAKEWEYLSATAGSMSLHAIAERAARYSLAPGAEEPADTAKLAMATALFGMGRFEEALANLPEQDTLEVRALRAIVPLCQGDAEGTVDQLRDAGPWDWPTLDSILAIALMLSGRPGEAVTVAEESYERCAPRVDEGEFRNAAIDAALLLGKLDEAERLLRPLVAEAPDFGDLERLAALEFLRGDGEQGISTMLEAVGLAQRLNLDEWEVVTEPSLHAIAGLQGATLPSLDPVTEAVRAAREKVPAQPEPLAEIEEEPGDESTNTARALVASMLLLAEGKPEAALTQLEPALSAAPGDRELTLLREKTERLAEPITTPAEAEAAPSPPEYAIELALPPSWFPPDSDPLRTHPMFLHHIPALRLSASWNVPGINVTTEDDLEPDGFLLRLLDRLAAEDRVQLDRVYVPAAAAQAFELPAEPPAGTAIRARLPDLMVVPHSAIDRLGPLGKLIGIGPEEVITRLLDSYGRERAAELEAA